MITCITCGKDVESEGFHGGVLVTPDGDFACSDACAEKYKKDRDYFFDVIIPDDRKFAYWLGVPVFSL